jgi:hypothetical protein
MVRDIEDKTYKEVPMELLAKLIELTVPDQTESERVWNVGAVAGSLKQFAHIRRQATGYLYTDRDRNLIEKRRETQGVLSGGEAGTVPHDKCTLFLLRTSAGRGINAAWWPQIRFPNGQYAFAFAV